jgi:nucleoside-diphosphate-sugar epimerase
MSVMITGGTGFIGAYIARKLIEQGREIILFDISPRLDLFKDLMESKSVKIVKGDISDIRDILINIKRHSVEEIVHLAYMHLTESEEKPWKAFSVNCGGVLNVFEAMRIANIKRVVYVNSVAVYGPSRYYDEYPVDEDTPPRPTTIYGVCRALDEFMAQHYHRKYGLDIVGIRPGGIVYGLGMIVHEWVKNMVEKSLLGEPVKVPYGNQRVDWQYVKDTANAFILALNAKNLKHTIFNTCGDVRTVREAAEIVKRFIPNAKIEIVDEGELPFPYLFDIKRAKEELGFEPHYTLEKGIKDYIETVKLQKGG